MEGNLHLKIEEGFLRYEFGGLIFGGAYTWRGKYFWQFTLTEQKEHDAIRSLVKIF